MDGLRRAALVAVLAGQVGAAVAGVLPVPLLVAALAVTALGVRVSAAAGPARAVLLRRGSNLGAALLAVAAVPSLTGADEDGLRGVLGPLLVGIVALQVWTWQAPRDVRTGVLAAGGLLVLGASYAPDVLVGLPLIVGWVAALVAIVLATGARAAEGADLVLTAPRPRSALLVAPALAAVLGLVAFLLVPVPEEAGLQSRLARAASDAGLPGSGRAAPGAYTGDTVDLRNRGELTDEPLIEVPSDSPVLWRSGVYSEWDGTTWSRPQRDRRVSGPPFVVASADGAPTRTDRVEVRFRAQGPVWSPGPVLRADVAGNFAFVDDFGAVRAPTWPAYTVRSAVVDPSLDQLRNASGADAVDARWTALPATVPARVTALGRELAGSARTRIDAVLAVEQWLAANATYRTDSPVPRRGEDAVDRFLFVDRVGFCEQFAAAEVLLLRAAGIPARFVTGFAYGVDGRDGRRTFRQKDLHAWVEVFHPGIGWVSSNPTPPSTQLAGAPLRTRVAAHLTQLLRQAETVPGGRAAVAAALLASCLAVATALLVPRRLRPTGAARPAAAPARADGRPALQAFLRYDARLGRRRRRPEESLRELQERLDLPPDVRDALSVVEQECYGPTPPADAPVAAQVLERARS